MKNKYLIAIKIIGLGFCFTYSLVVIHTWDVLWITTITQWSPMERDGILLLNLGLTVLAAGIYL